MTEEVLRILPPRGLDQSILVAILVGVWVLQLFREWFGWVFVGLVVPGYLASVFIIAPASGATIVFEAIATYLLARFVSDTIAKTDAWSPYFGRDRFLLIVIASVIVRQASELWFLSASLGWFDRIVGTDIYAERDFYSIGLVLVPLTANMFWKLDVRRGIVQIGVPIVVTYVIVRAVLLPWTNLSFSMMELTYEDAALDFLGSAKAYIILLTGGFVAARCNLLFGWDYNGILVPSLLALAWFEPKTVLVTIVEALLLAVVTIAVLATPALRSVNLEGPRKVTLVFTLGFVLKFGFGWSVWLSGSDLDVPGLFGFGYVLTSLLAVKMVTKRVVGRVVVPTVVVSGVAFASGTALGFGLAQVVPEFAPAAVERPGGETRRIFDDPVGIALAAQARSRTSPADVADDDAARRPILASDERVRFERLWDAVARWIAADAAPPPETLRAGAEALGLELRAIANGDYVLLEREERLARQRGRDTAWLRPGHAGPVLEVPKPGTEPSTALAAALACERVRCRAVLFSGTDTGPGASTDTHPRSTFRIAHAALSRFPIVRLRADLDGVHDGAAMHVRRLPDDIDIRDLWEGEVELRWSAPRDAVADWSVSPRFAVLRVTGGAYERELGERYGLGPDRDAPEVSGRASGAVHSEPTATDLRALEFLADRVLALTDPESDAGDARLTARMANVFGYRLERDDAGDVWQLLPGSDTAWRFGTLEVRANGSPIVLSVPRPDREPGTAGLAGTLADALGATAIAISAVEPEGPEGPEGAKGAEAADDPTSGSPLTATHALHQSLHRALSRRGGGAVLQVRGLSTRHGVPQHAVVGLGTPWTGTRELPAAIRDALDPDGPVARLGGDVAFADGDRVPAALVGRGNLQIAYSLASGGVVPAVLWFGESVRARFAADPGDRWRRAIEAVGLEITPGDPREAIAGRAARGRGVARSSAARIERGLSRFAESRNVLELAEVVRLGATDAAVTVAAHESPRDGVFLRVEIAGADATTRIVRFAGGRSRCLVEDGRAAATPEAAVPPFAGCHSLVAHTPRRTARADARRDGNGARS